MDHYSPFTDLPGIVEDEYGHCDRTWNSGSNYYQWNATGSLAARFSDMYEYKVPFGTPLAHDMSRFERFLVQPHYTPHSAHILPSSTVGLDMSSPLAFNTPYESAFPDSYPRQSSPADTNSSRRSICHSDDASTDRTARNSLSSNSDYSPSQMSYADYPAFSAPCSQTSLGGGIALSEIQQYPDDNHVDPDDYETTEEIEQDATTLDQDTIRCGSKIELGPHPGEDLPMKEEPAAFDRDDTEQPDVKEEDEESDAEYKPNRKSSLSKRPRRRSSQSSNGSNSKINIKRQSRGRKGSLSIANNDRVKKSKGHKSKQSVSDTTLRPFPCPLASYGCESTFTSKNEWKRHVSTQHIKLGFWRCDMCPPTNNSDPYNDFNRKDLFTQHLRRMHADVAVNGANAPTSPTKKGLALTNAIPEDVIAEYQTRCYVRVRSPPQKSSCLMCSRTFSGPGSWTDRMDHVGSHFERDRKNTTNGTKVTDVEGWREDPVLRDWLQEEGLVGVDEKGTWRIGDGVPLRQRVATEHE
ncbi:hypothetical protein NA57DRAFT_55531 [Rhizodiscina lignyota]|uniref:C2H2-type domain-containing protein n=1 Tax=Rhizodiscina lignyota TaxID=1504668 RepID=A0A9P4IGH4_9PEZI|nr:hypothetical protein NA57DRAFT_55531 [Rhizodiscina lignyota]